LGFIRGIIITELTSWPRPGLALEDTALKGPTAAMMLKRKIKVGDLVKQGLWALS